MKGVGGLVFNDLSKDLEIAIEKNSKYKYALKDMRLQLRKLEELKPKKEMYNLDDEDENLEEILKLGSKLVRKIGRASNLRLVCTSFWDEIYDANDNIQECIDKLGKLIDEKELEKAYEEVFANFRRLGKNVDKFGENLQMICIEKTVKEVYLQHQEAPNKVIQHAPASSMSDQDYAIDLQKQHPSVVSTRFEGKEPNKSVNPDDEAVAYGAASILSGEGGEETKVVLSDDEHQDIKKALEDPDQDYGTDLRKQLAGVYSESGGSGSKLKKAIRINKLVRRRKRKSQTSWHRCGTCAQALMPLDVPFHMEICQAEIIQCGICHKGFHPLDFPDHMKICCKNEREKALKRAVGDENTDEKGVATYKGIPFMTSAGPCTSSIAKGSVK